MMHQHFCDIALSVKKMELELISGSSAAGEPASCALVYRLDRDANSGDLPAVDEMYPWAGKTISALRDRLMIRWVLSFDASKKLLRKMVDEITTALRRRRSSESVKKSLRVCVLCSNGAQLSPCFVEKLYDNFSYGMKGMEGMKVSRHHRDAMRGNWGHCKDFVWEVSCIPINSAHSKIRFNDVFNSRMWLNFDPTANSESERQFRKNPLLSRLQFSDMVLDFESGTAYSNQRRETYYIRCSHISPSKTNCWILTDAGYKHNCQSFGAAGIQPYSIHPKTGEAVFLLGRITYGSCDWCDFGGLKSSRFWREQPRLTAARECAEETLEILGTSAKLASALKDYETNNCFKILNMDTQYVGHFLRVPYCDYPGIFEEVLREKGDCVIEVDEMKWFSLSSMKNAVKSAHIQPQRIITVKALKEDGTVDESRLHPLRKPFVSTLCIADALNILDSIAAIARSVHKKKVPSGTAMPYVCTPEPDELQSEAVACEPPSSDSHTTLESAVAGIELEQSSESDSETEDDTYTNNDTGSSDDDDDQYTSGHLRRTSSSGNHSNSGSSELGKTNQVSPRPELDLDDRNVETVENSPPSCIKSKPFSGGKGKKRQGSGHHQKTKRRGRNVADSRAQPYSFKKNKRKHKQCLLYGMGAGSFPIGEVYMNS